MTPLFPRLHERPEDTARRERTEHRDACAHCVAGLDCPTGDDPERRLTEAASAGVSWPGSPKETA